METTEVPSKIVERTNRTRRGVGYAFRDKRSGGVVWSIAYEDVDGRLRRERTNAMSRTLAERILADRQDAVERARLQGLPSVDALLAPKPAMTLRAFAKDYLEHVWAHLAPASAQRYDDALRVHILPKLGGLTLQRVNPGDVQKYSDERLRVGAAPRTVLKEVMILSGMFRDAIKRELAERNPVSLIDKPKANADAIRFLDGDEAARLLAMAAEPLRSAIVVAIHSGLREGEQTHLTWSDVRFGTGPEDSSIVVRLTKGKRDRVVPMSRTLYNTLKAIPKRFRAERDGSKHPVPWVFANPDTGDRYDRFNNTTWRHLLRDVGIRCKWHTLRATFGSSLAQAGVPLIAIRDLLGHADVTTTARYYASVAPSNLRAAVKALDSAPVQAENGPITTHGTTHRAVDTVKAVG